jgi:hypothetical protein
MKGMATRTGRRSWSARCWAGGWALAAVVWSLGACGDGKSPGAEPGLDPTGPVGEPDAGANGEQPVEATPDAGGEGSGFELPLLPPRVSVSGVCTPGATQQCLFEQLCSGLRTCVADGSGFGACQCESTPAIGVGIVGARCASNADCGGGATCFTAAGNDYTGQGGPAGGYCTFPCAASTDCAAFDLESRCVPMGPNGANYCIRTCLSKDAQPGEAKCLNRADLVCVSVAADGVEPLAAERQPGYCAPRCGSDAECPGRVCHRQGGFCTDVTSPGQPSGARCELDTQCDGQACEDRTDGVGTCTAECVLGSLAGCGYGRDDPARKAACLIPLVAAGRFGEGPGDMGLCRELCSVDSDCLRAAEGFVCRPLNAALAAFTGRTGGCSRPPAAAAPQPTAE